MQEGQKALAALEMSTAAKKLNQAIDALSKVLPYIKKAELADAMMALGATQFLDNDRKSAVRTFIRLITWRQDYKIDTNKYAPQLIAPFEDARKEVEKAKRGSLEIRSEPGAAEAYVDGKYIGVTPTFAEGLPAGEHWVTLKKEGYRKAVMAANVSIKVQQMVSLPLERSGKYLLVEQALAAVEKTLGKPQLEATADNLKEVLFIDHAVFVRVTQPKGGVLAVDAYLYDLRTRRRLTRVEKTVPANDAERQLQGLATTLYSNVSYEAVEEGPHEAPPPKPVTRRAFYKTWWFWTVAGVVVAGAVAGGVAGSLLQPKSCGSNYCPGVTF